MQSSIFLDKRLRERKAKNAFRTMQLPGQGIDFSSNDYLGIVTNKLLAPEDKYWATGATGSRLLTGNYGLVEETEKVIAGFHQANAGLIYNSGYDANVGLLSCVARKGDTIFYDELSHASIRDGIKLSLATAYSFRHNDPEDLESKLRYARGNVFIVTESVFSMDGDLAPLQEISGICDRYQAHLVVDEAHATGVIGEHGEGLVQLLSLEQRCFARIHTFGKAVGCQGAIVLGSDTLRDYLINFSRPFIYTTALPALTVSAIKKAYEMFPYMAEERKQLSILIKKWKDLVLSFPISNNNTPIQHVFVPGNSEIKKVAQLLQRAGLDVRPILYPSVKEGTERLRVILHSFNTVDQLLQFGKAFEFAPIN